MIVNNNLTKVEFDAVEYAIKRKRDWLGRIDAAINNAEKKSSVEISKILKTQGVAIEIVITSTGLSKEEIENL